jgi:hypothetical protein
MGGTPVSNRHKADSVKALLGSMSKTPLARIKEQSDSHTRVRKWLEKQLPADLAARLSGVVEREDTLVIFTEAAVWCARVRYAVAEIEPALLREFPHVSVVTVRVLPRDAGK